VRVKNSKKSARSVRYLLSANQKLQRISLKRLSTRAKHARKRPRAARPKEAVVATPLIVKHDGPIPVTPVVQVKPAATAPWGIALVVVGVTAAAVLMAVRQTPPDAEPKSRARLDAAPRSQQAEIAREKKPSPATADSAERLESTPRPAVAGLVAPALPAAHPELASHTQSEAPKTEVHASPRVTITGCLAFDDQTYWLKDTEGLDAPKSRSWKSGFLKKRSSNVELVDAGHTLQLPRYVGQRVSATGTLADREMHASALQRVAPSCS
jgi:hypothetical protein